MFVPFIKRTLTAAFICACTLSVKSQQIYFVYLQTDNSQPFYVKFDNKIISSSTSGYLILPKLVDSDYNINIGFPKKEFPEERFQFSVHDKSEGFLLKNFNDKGWGLFNMRTLALVMGIPKDNSPVATKNLQDDSFSKMLANVVKDSSILEKNEPEKDIVVAPRIDSSNRISEVPKPDSAKENNVVAINNKADSVEIQKQSVEIPRQDEANVARPDSANLSRNYALNSIDSSTSKANTEILKTEPRLSLLKPAARYFRRNVEDGMEMVYIDPNENGNDTVRLLISKAKTASLQAPDTNAIAQNQRAMSPVLKDTSLNVIGDKTNSSENSSANKDSSTYPTKGITEEINSKKKEDSIVIKKTEEEKPAQQEIVKRKTGKAIEGKRDAMVVLPKVLNSAPTNSDCKAFATNEDFLRLRKKMASENNDEQMIKIAKKTFHSKCFSTEQIKNLSFLFLTNDGKYKFFDEAYPFASDSDQFKMLQSQLTDSYYINRFNAMIHQ